MKLFVTGGAGFIGSVFTTMALDGSLNLPGLEAVTVYDALTYAGTLTNLTQCAKDPRFSFVRGDICDEETLHRAMSGHDAVIHFAAESHVDRSINGATTFAHTNVVGTAAVMQAAHDVGVERGVHVSTDEVYGSIPSGSWPETDPLVPTSPYSASKAGSDLVAQSFFRSFNLPVVVTRCSNNYGPHQFPEKLIPLFVTNLMEGKKVPVYGDGSARRDWLQSLATEQRACCFFESPHRIEQLLADAADVLGPDRRGAVCRELTKTYEEVKRGTLGELAEWAAGGVRGESPTRCT